MKKIKTHQYVADPIDYVLSPEKLIIRFFFFCGYSVGNINGTVRQGKVSRKADLQFLSPDLETGDFLLFF